MNDLDCDDTGMAGVSMMICRGCRWTGSLRSTISKKIFDKDVHLCPVCGSQVTSILPVYVVR